MLISIPQSAERRYDFDMEAILPHLIDYAELISGKKRFPKRVDQLNEKELTSIQRKLLLEKMDELLELDYHDPVGWVIVNLSP